MPFGRMPKIMNLSAQYQYITRCYLGIGFYFVEFCQTFELNAIILCHLQQRFALGYEMLAVFVGCFLGFLLQPNHIAGRYGIVAMHIVEFRQLIGLHIEFGGERGKGVALASGYALESSAATHHMLLSYFGSKHILHFALELRVVAHLLHLLGGLGCRLRSLHGARKCLIA